MNIEYKVIDENEIDMVAPLWEKLNEHHGRLSQHFGYEYPNRTWDNRKKELIGETTGLHVDLAKDTDTEVLVGYCISSIKRDGLGEIDSIYIESDYRRKGIGDNLMNRALQWLKESSADRIIVQVIVDNGEAFPFYQRYGFFPRSIIFMQIVENDTSGS